MVEITERQRLFLQTLATLAQGSDMWIDAMDVDEIMGSTPFDFIHDLVDLYDKGLIDQKVWDVHIRLTEDGRAAI